MTTFPLALWMLEASCEIDEQGVAATFHTENGKAAPRVIDRIFSDGTGCVATTERLADRRYRVHLQTESRGAAFYAAQRLMGSLPLFHGDDPTRPDCAIALGWHTLPGAGAARTALGELEYRAKRHNDTDAASQLGSRVSAFASGHHLFSSAEQVLAAPSSARLVEVLSNRIGESLGVDVLRAQKRDPSSKQQDDSRTFDECLASVKDSMVLPDLRYARSVLIVDDLYQKGVTIAELTRCLRTRGVNQVFSITISKTATYHRQA